MKMAADGYQACKALIERASMTGKVARGGEEEETEGEGGGGGGGEQDEAEEEHKDEGEVFTNKHKHKVILPFS